MAHQAGLDDELVPIDQSQLRQRQRELTPLTRSPLPDFRFFVLLLMVVLGSQILIYPVLWILMPSEETDTAQPPLAPPASAA